MPDESTNAATEGRPEVAASQRCVSCGYDLRGLPSVCTCPECGFESDPYAKIVEYSPRRWHLQQVVLGVGLLALAMWIGRPSNASAAGALIFYGLVAGVTVIYFVAFCWTVGERSRLLLSRQGVRFDDPRLDRGWIDWSRIERARYSWLFARFYLLGTDGRELLSMHWRQLGSPRSARKCRSAINEQLQRYCRARGARSSPPSQR